MSATPLLDPQRYVAAIRAKGLTIYDPIAIGDVQLWIPTPELQALLDEELRDLSLGGLPLRTRSKVVKTRICEALGYPAPSSFKKTRPRFPGQSFDTYTQKSNNLQIWNEELSPSRRYVIIRVSETGAVTRVRVVTGDTLAKLDTTGTLTRKYQAKCIPGAQPTELIAAKDTTRLLPFVQANMDLNEIASPLVHPTAKQILSIGELYTRLSPLVGKRFADTGADQERNRVRCCTDWSAEHSATQPTRMTGGSPTSGINFLR